MSEANSSNFISRLAEHRKLVEQAALKAVYEYGSMVITNAKTITPVDTGKLASSGGVEPPKINGDSVTIVIGFGAAYAAAVHENLNARHAAGTQAKYLEVPMRRMASQFAPFVGGRIKAATGG